MNVFRLSGIAVSCAVFSAVLCVLVSARSSAAESALELLSGFDVTRLDAVFPINDEETAGEMAKALYRLRRADAGKMAAKAEATVAAAGAVQIGDAVRVDGTITAMRRFKVPEKLVEFLEFESYLELQLQLSENPAVPGESILVYAPEARTVMSVGDRVAANGVVVDITLSAASALAAGTVQWYPSTPASPGWQLLADEGVDISAIAAVSARNRQPLTAEDKQPFYEVLSAAQAIGLRDDLIAPTAIDPVQLLRDPEKHVGDWVRIKLNTVRITRVSVSNAEQRTQLGQDHYYQVDASGSLGDVIVRMNRPDDPDGPPIELDNSYPVSLVTTQLPEFLLTAVQSSDGAGGAPVDALVTMINHPVSVDAFFFRLWSYDSEFMTKRGGGKQVGPLLMVARWRSTAPSARSGGGIDVIGYSLLTLLVVTVLGTFLWNRLNAKEDRLVRERQQERESSELRLPGEG
ncbi:hypothetical protein [Stieleria varia]|uniref:Uncharacterized protein n=1 Tax=Stieleria varia TaxID=2528005 RepID=A0A5C6B6E9_9BACT|nr:hypothetical protein [Stieleria varia]TWU07855.1 hypothetical protein Pla52n_04310 [Stieleria varia]